ncbi:hypothetical protein KKH27_09790 [bacterium]|nr:hypothetical protein [bacterium]MBU1983540.1 hypothetical protein [bacterium]
MNNHILSPGNASMRDPSSNMVSEFTIDFDSSVAWIEWFLHNNGIDMQSTWPITQLLSRRNEAKTLFKKLGSESLENESLSLLCDTISLGFIVKAVFAASSRGDYEWLLPHLRKCLPVPLFFGNRTLSNTRHNLYWELICASIFSVFCDNVRMEAPDFRARFNTVDWGIACKVLYSKNRDQQAKTITDGAKQIEKSSAEYGVVMVDASHLIKHEEYLSHKLEKPVKHASDLIADLRNTSRAMNIRHVIYHTVKDPITGGRRDKTRSIFLSAQTISTDREIPVLATAAIPYEFRPVIGPELSLQNSYFEAMDRVFATEVHGPK